MKRTQLELVVAGTSEGDADGGVFEAKELTEEVMLGAVTFGHKKASSR